MGWLHPHKGGRSEERVMITPPINSSMRGGSPPLQRCVEVELSSLSLPPRQMGVEPLPLLLYEAEPPSTASFYGVKVHWISTFFQKIKERIGIIIYVDNIWISIII
jgi:hypothetical protein